MRLYVDGQAAGTADGSGSAASPDWRWRMHDPVVAFAVRPVADDLGQPVVSITLGTPPPTTCDYHAEAVRRRGGHPGGAAGSARIRATNRARVLTIDLFEDDNGAIAVVSVILAGGTGLGPPPWVRTRDDLDALDD